MSQPPTSHLENAAEDAALWCPLEGDQTRGHKAETATLATPGAQSLLSAEGATREWPFGHGRWH